MKKIKQTIRKFIAIPLAALLYIGMFNFGFIPTFYASQSDLPERFWDNWLHSMPADIAPGNIEQSHWDYIQEILPLNAPIQIFDIETGITYNVASLSNGNHADVEPLTFVDTALMLYTFGGEHTWSSRPVWVTFGGRTFAAAIHNMPHDIYTILDNNMDGHVCLHFYGSTTHNTNESVHLGVILSAMAAYEMFSNAAFSTLYLPTQPISEIWQDVSDMPLMPEEEDDIALPSSHNITINGQDAPIAAYNINGSNFFRLRHIAYMLNGTASQFEIAWDSIAQVINLLPGSAYTPIGTEITTISRQGAQAVPSVAAVQINGQTINLQAYNINGYNYFMLRDLADVLGFTVGWDYDARTVLINTN